LNDPAPNLAQGDAANEGKIRVSKDQERIGQVSIEVIGIGGQPTPERSAGEIIIGPSGLPRLKIGL
jgi:hypothetical protein